MYDKLISEQFAPETCYVRYIVQSTLYADIAKIFISYFDQETI